MKFSGRGMHFNSAYFLTETFVSRIIETGVIRLLLFLFKAVGTFIFDMVSVPPG